MINQSVSHYKIQQCLGEGGMGVVYKAIDTRLDRPVALKFLSEQMSREPQALERFRQEAKAASALNHPQICTIYDIGEHQGRPFIVMEYLEGRSLKERIQAGPITIGDVFDYAIQVAGALEAAHARGIIHRDIKPANIFITNSGQAKILDFGLAKLAPAEAGMDVSTTAGAGLTTAGTTVGTVAYMSPEQARAEEVDPRSDLFSLGVVIYEMATGQQAFAGSSVALVYDSILNREPAPAAQVNRNLPMLLDHTIQKALEKDRRMRYQHSSELRIDLERLRRDWNAGKTQSYMPVPLSTTPMSPAPMRDVTPTPFQSHISIQAAEILSPPPASAGGTSPKKAFWLGMIPGVGALYNAQYKKAAVHFIAFAALSGLSNAFAKGGLGSFFSYLIFGLWAYMVFDSYHTAKTRLKPGP